MVLNPDKLVEYAPVVYLPFPKYEQKQDRYYSLVHMCFEPIAISANVGDPERTALITEALCYYSDTFDEEVEKILLKERLSSDKDSRELLQLTLNSKVYDFEYTANVMGWTSEANHLFVNEQLDGYAPAMTAMAKQAIKSSGAGKLQLFLASYGKLNFRR